MLDGTFETITGTTIHPVWSVDRKEWVPLNELIEGETLQGLDGLAVVLSVTLSRVAEPVYNIEVHGEHVYQVGELGVLVHNTCFDDAPKEAADVLVRRGVDRESAQRLAKQAEAAANAGTAKNGVPYGHGVSVTTPEMNQILAKNPSDAVSATRKAIEEAGFEIRHTPTRADDFHHTIQLPKPVTEEVAELFNRIFGRKAKGG